MSRGLRVVQADLARATDAFGRLAVVLFRLSQSAPGPLGTLVSVVLRILCGVELPRSVEAGPGLRLAHGGRGTVVHYRSRIGSDVTIYHGVTVGVAQGDQQPPVIGDRAYLGAGCCVLGSVTVGDGATVGANAVVLQDVPVDVTAVGIPARLLSR